MAFKFRKSVNSSTFVKTEIKDEIQFESTDLADMIQPNLNKSHEVNATLRPQKAQKPIFKSKQRKNNFEIKSRPAYSIRDIELGLLLLEIKNTGFQTADEVIRVYLLKSIFWSTFFLLPLIVIGGANILISHFAGLMLPTPIVFGSCLTVTAFGYIWLLVTRHRKDKYNKLVNATMPIKKNPFMETLIKNISEKFEYQAKSINLSLRPEIRIKLAQNESTITVGLPLIQQCSASELVALICSEFERARIKRESGTDALLKRQDNLISMIDSPEKRSLVDTFDQYATSRLNKMINVASIICAIQATNIDTLVSAIEKQIRLKRGYRNSLINGNTSEIIPINAITQIACASETRDIREHTECLNVSSIIKGLIDSQSNKVELLHKRSHINLEFAAHWLLNNPNSLANTLSMDALQQIGFEKQQLRKTHDTHRVFIDVSELDPVHHFFHNLYRPNRVLTLSLNDSESGSLLTLKSDLMRLHKSLISEQSRAEELLTKWDCFLAPHYTRQLRGTPEGGAAERVNTDLTEIDSLFAERIGLCVNITLSIGTSEERQDVYALLEANRKINNIVRSTDALIHAIAVLKRNPTTRTMADARNCLKIMIGLCNGMTSFKSKNLTLQPPHIHSEADVQLMKHREILENGISLVYKIEDYRWNIDKQLVSLSHRVEERLAVTKQ